MTMMMATMMMTVPDILSGQEVQQLCHVSGPLPKLHGELADPVIQNQSSVHALSDQRQLHVSAAHHDSHPGGVVTWVRS